MNKIDIEKGNFPIIANLIESELREKIEFFNKECNRLRVELIMENNPITRYHIEKNMKVASAEVEKTKKLLETVQQSSILENAIPNRTTNTSRNKQQHDIKDENSVNSLQRQIDYKCHEGKLVKIFISHSHQNANSAIALVDLLLTNLSLEDSDIRCTSVPGHGLKLGKSIVELLKEDISLTPIFIALISKESLKSEWVMFELGAAWGLNRSIYPILGPKLQIRELLAPLSNLHCIEIESPYASSSMSELIKQLAQDLTVEQKSGGKAQAHLETFLNQYKSGPHSNAGTTSHEKSPEDKEDSVLLSIWKITESEFDEHGYSLEAIAKRSSISIPMCEHLLTVLMKRDFVDKKTWMGGINGTRYLLKDAGRTHLIQKKLVE